MKPVVAIWAQSLLGSGHDVRMRLLSDALETQGCGVHWLAPRADNDLPHIRARDASFALVDAAGMPVGEDTWRLRREWLRSAIERQPPNVLVIEMWPFGRRAFQEEVLFLIDLVRRNFPSCRIIGSLRDLLVSKAKFSRYWQMLDQALAQFDHMLIHSDEHIVPFSLTFPFERELRSIAHYTGFVTKKPFPRRASQHGRKRVLVIAGGGRVGRRMFKTCLAAQAASFLPDWQWDLITGANQEQPELHAMAANHANVHIYGYVNDLPSRLSLADLLISQAGYNSCWEALAAEVPAILVPFADNGQDEQPRRASILERLAPVVQLGAEAFNPNGLRKAARTLEHVRTQRQFPPCRFDGADNSARFIAGCIRGDSP